MSYLAVQQRLFKTRRRFLFISKKYPIWFGMIFIYVNMQYIVDIFYISV